MKSFDNFDGMARPEFWLEHQTVGKRAYNRGAFESGKSQVLRLVRQTEELKSMC